MGITVRRGSCICCRVCNLRLCVFMHLKLLIVYQNCCQIKVLEGCCGPCCPRKKCVCMCSIGNTLDLFSCSDSAGVYVCVSCGGDLSSGLIFFHGLTHSTIQTHTHAHIRRSQKKLSVKVRFS